MPSHQNHASLAMQCQLHSPFPKIEFIIQFPQIKLAVFIMSMHASRIALRIYYSLCHFQAP